MSSIASKTSHAAPEPGEAGWFADLLGTPLPAEGQSIVVCGTKLTMASGILRAAEVVSEAQEQTRRAFGFKWAKRETFEGEFLGHARQWLGEKWGDMSRADWLYETADRPIVLDAGCGAGVGGLITFGATLDRVRYLGVDVSDAVDVAMARFAEQGRSGAFLQADLNQLPLPEASVDIIYSDGVLHHTDHTARSLARVVRHLKPGGRILFYVYRRKGPIREFADDFIRNKISHLSGDEGWAALMPLSKLGKALGELNVEIEVPEAIELLEIPAGRVNLQRLFYWHVFKAFYHPKLTLDEMNHINFDWYAPINASRHTVEEVRDWCGALSLEIERERVEEAGISITARKLPAS
jgi:SAM-dependent methyltransferase